MVGSILAPTTHMRPYATLSPLPPTSSTSTLHPHPHHFLHLLHTYLNTPTHSTTQPHAHIRTHPQTPARTHMSPLVTLAMQAAENEKRWIEKVDLLESQVSTLSASLQAANTARQDLARASVSPPRDAKLRGQAAELRTRFVQHVLSAQLSVCLMFSVLFTVDLQECETRRGCASASQ